MSGWLVSIAYCTCCDHDRIALSRTLTSLSIVQSVTSLDDAGYNRLDHQKNISISIFLLLQASNGVMPADTPGAVYNIPPTLNLQSGVSFGTGPQMSGSLDVNKKYPESSIDIMRLTVDNQKHK